MMKLQGNPVESYQLLCETLQERSYFLQSAPFQNRQLSLFVPSESLLATTFWFFPGTLLYHMIYLKEMLRSSFTEQVSGPKIVSKWDIRRRMPNMKGMKNSWAVKMHEV